MFKPFSAKFRALCYERAIGIANAYSLYSADTGQMRDAATTAWLPDLSGLQVLVIEDDEDARNILAEVLKFAGAIVTACSDAYAGLNNLNQLRHDVIVCDLALPRMDGVTFLQALRAHRDPNTRQIPVLAVTAYSEVYGPTQLLRLGCEAYMMKPLSLDRVCTAVQKLGARSTRRSDD
jgi:CheY-like chemotaxis protein